MFFFTQKGNILGSHQVCTADIISGSRVKDRAEQLSKGRAVRGRAHRCLKLVLKFASGSSVGNRAPSPEHTEHTYMIADTQYMRILLKIIGLIVIACCFIFIVRSTIRP